MHFYTRTVTYKGYLLTEFVPQRTYTYISLRDLLNAEMTLRETLDFSSECQRFGSRYGGFSCMHCVFANPVTLGHTDICGVQTYLQELFRHERE